MCVRACVRACVREFLLACLRACVRACMCVHIYSRIQNTYDAEAEYLPEYFSSVGVCKNQFTDIGKQKYTLPGFYTYKLHTIGHYVPLNKSSHVLFLSRSCLCISPLFILQFVATFLNHLQ